MPMIYCQDCGEKIPQNARFCPRCGFRFDKGTSAPPPFTLTKSTPAVPRKEASEDTQEPEKVTPEKEPEPEKVTLEKKPEPEKVTLEKKPEPEKVTLEKKPEPEKVTLDKKPEPEKVTLEKKPEPEKVTLEKEPEPEKVTLEKKPEPDKKPEPKKLTQPERPFSLQQTTSKKERQQPQTSYTPPEKAENTKANSYSSPSPSQDINTDAAPMTFDRSTPQRVNYTASDVVTVRKNSKAPTVIIIIVLILLIAGAGAFVYFKFFNNSGDENSAGNNRVSSAASADSIAPSSSADKESSNNTGDNEELDLRGMCYDAEHYNYSYTTIAADDSYIEIDTNPLDKEGYSDTEALEFIEEINRELGFSDSLINEMKNATEPVSSKTVENDRISLKWQYSEDTGLVVRYTKK